MIPLAHTCYPRRPLGAVSRVQLGRMLQPDPKSDLDLKVPYLRATNVQDGRLGLDDVKEMFCSPLDADALRLNRGDLLVCEGGDVGRVSLVDDEFARTTIFQNSVHRVVPGANMESRYLFYVLQAFYLESDYYSVLCNGATIRHLTVDKLRRLPVPVPPPGQQRQIADFLDAQVAVLNRAVMLRRMQMGLLDERRGASFLEALEDVAGITVRGLDPASRADDWRPLGRVLKELTNGFVGPTRDLLVEDGVPYLQSLHIKQGGIDFKRRPYFVPASWVAERPRITLRPDDLLIVQTGALGEVALVTDAFAGASCHALLIARTGGAVRPDYLWHLFRSDWGKNALLRRKTGALHPHLEAGEIRDILIPIPSPAQQVEIVRRVAARESEHVRTLAVLSHSETLIEERKKALITAVISGSPIVRLDRSVA